MASSGSKVPLDETLPSPTITKRHPLTSHRVMCPIVVATAVRLQLALVDMLTMLSPGLAQVIAGWVPSVTVDVETKQALEDMVRDWFCISHIARVHVHMFHTIAQISMHYITTFHSFDQVRWYGMLQCSIECSISPASGTFSV